MNMQLSGS